MLWLNRQNMECVGRNLSLDKYVIGFRQFIFAKTDFDSDLPICRRAYLDVVCWVNDEIFGCWTQLWIIQKEPQKRMRVEQQPHGMYSLKSSRCVSSSVRMTSFPLALPGRRGLRMGRC